MYVAWGGIKNIFFFIHLSHKEKKEIKGIERLMSPFKLIIKAFVNIMKILELNNTCIIAQSA